MSDSAIFRTIGLSGCPNKYNTKRIIIQLIGYRSGKLVQVVEKDSRPVADFIMEYYLCY